jgi:hypothetical protein
MHGERPLATASLRKPSGSMSTTGFDPAFGNGRTRAPAVASFKTTVATGIAPCATKIQPAGVQNMFRAFMALTALFLLILGASEASAQDYPAYRVVAQGTGNCLKLKSPETDNGGLTTAPCQNFADFFVTIVGNPGQFFPLQFRLTSSRWVCIVATENPTPQPSDRRSKVTTQKCAGPDSQWDIFGPDSDGFVKFDKIRNSIDPSQFCIFNNTQSGEIELEVCEGGTTENWKLDPVFK